MSLNENDQLHVIMYGNKNVENKTNVSILLTTTIKFIKNSERFDQPLFKPLLRLFSFLHPYPS